MQEKSKIFLIWVKGKDLKNFKGSKVLKDNKERRDEERDGTNGHMQAGTGSRNPHTMRDN